MGIVLLRKLATLWLVILLSNYIAKNDANQIPPAENICVYYFWHLHRMLGCLPDNVVFVDEVFDTNVSENESGPLFFFFFFFAL